MHTKEELVVLPITKRRRFIQLNYDNESQTSLNVILDMAPHNEPQPYRSQESLNKFLFCLLLFSLLMIIIVTLL